jgi:hypothetical protein
MREPAPQGYFSGVEDGVVRGWIAAAEGATAAVRVRVNGQVAWDGAVDGPDARRTFGIACRLVPGDRVQVLDADGRALPGGVRGVRDPAWRPRLAIVSPVREEARYLLEWIAYHRALGVELFVLGDNGGADHTSELLMALAACGLVERLDWRDAQHFQTEFNAAAVSTLCGRVDVCSVTDVDEFLRPLEGRDDLVEVVAELFARDEVSSVAMAWATYGSCGREEPGEGLVLERFTRRAADDFQLHHTVKSLYRPERFDPTPAQNTHAPALTHGLAVDDRGEPVRWHELPGIPTGISASISWNSVRVDHFVTKSRREFAAKARRGVVCLPVVPPRDDAFFDLRDRNEVDDPVPAELLAQTKEEMARLTTELAPLRGRWPDLAGAL